MHSYSYLLSIPIDLIEARIEVYPALWRGFGMCKSTLFTSPEPHSHQKSLYIGSPLVRSFLGLPSWLHLPPPPSPTSPRVHDPYKLLYAPSSQPQLAPLPPRGSQALSPIE